ncbi:ATPase, T2SS/T4P/T4SS family [Inhella sp.]|uniref:GspE/PulE family protein n=1 Tax=Inhella sp. TaxID=1921806 RepID=UPI0035AF5503
MSESLPPLEWSAAPGAATSPGAAPDAFAWPTPPFAAYPAPQPLLQPVAVEVTAANGSRSIGQLIRLLPAQRLVHLLMPPAKNAMAVKFNQLASLKLMRPVQAAAARTSADAETLALDLRPRIEFHVRLRNGHELKGSTIGHAQDELGLFLFLPVSPSDDSVQQLFVPREAVENCDFGDRLGELLVEQKLISSEQANDALRQQAELRGRKVGDILVANQVVSAAQLLEAIEQQSRMPIVRIGEALVAMELISQAQLDAALAQQRQDRSVPLGELLVRSQVVTRAQLQSALARKMGYPLVDIDRFEPEMAALRKLPVAAARRLEVLPLLLREGRLVVAMEDPTRREAIDEVEFIAQLKVVPALAKIGSVAIVVPTAYQRVGALDASSAASETLAPISLDFDPAPATSTGKLVESLERETAERGVDLTDERPIEQSDNSLVRLINNMIIEAHEQKVSDIHIECQPGRDKVKVRFRKDGVLSPYLELPPSFRNALVARIKVMCELDISERRKPQDGKINFAKFSPQHKLELRVATIPTNNGLEDVVMRLLASAKPLPLPQLGLAPANLERLQAAVARPYGMVLCVGPTGSGKTTTLHSVLGSINTPDRKIWTAEDPVEITQAGLRQVQVNPKIDWTFAKALRAFLRADPDVIMVGEIRDQETAEIAIEASLTGHLVLSTLHTNSAAETVTRLLDMGADPFNFGDSLLAVLAQRLVRRICPHCRQQEPMSDGDRDELLDDYLHAFPVEHRPEREHLLEQWQARFAVEGALQRWHSAGCPKCDGSGYKGRAGIHELLVVSREIRRLIQTGARAETIQHQALLEGLRTLRQDGIDKVLAGITSLGEVRATANA